MAANNAFTLQGSTTQTPRIPSSFGTSGSTPVASIATPASNALNRAYGGTDRAITSNPAAVFAKNNNITPAPQPAIKSQTVTKTDYHPPTMPGLLSNPSSQPVGDKTGNIPDTSSGQPGLTGNVQTPSGATVNAETGGMVGSRPTYPGLVSSLVDTAQGNIGIGQHAADIANHYGQEYADVGRKGANAESGYLTTGTSPVAEGNSAIIAQNTAAQQTAIAKGEEAALQGTSAELTGQSQAQSGLNSAVNATKPELGAYGQNYYSPLGGGQNGAGGVQPNDPFYQTLQNYAQMAANGQLSEIPSSITSNPVLNDQMNQMAKGINPNYNPVLSSASAATQQTGQKISAAIPPANQALDALQEAFNKLPAIQSTGVPILNQFTQSAAMATGLGRDQASAFQGALNEARSRIDAALTGIIGVDAAAAQSHALLPDNMIGSELPQKIAAAKQYLQNQLESYTKSGQQNANANTTANGAAPAGWL